MSKKFHLWPEQARRNQVSLEINSRVQSNQARGALGREYVW